MKYVVRIALVFAVLVTVPLQAIPQSLPHKILIGILPEMNVFKQKQRFKLLSDYLTKKTGIPVEVTILSRYGNIIEQFTGEKMDGAFFGSFTGALAIEKLGVVPLARPVNLDNTSHYRGYIFVRKDSAIRTATDMKGKKMAFVEKATTAGYIFPRAYLREHGITDMDRFFSDSFFAGSHDAAINAVLSGRADVGAAKHSIYDRMRKEDPRIDRELLVIAKSPWVPSNGLCVRKDLDKTAKVKLRDALLTMDRDPEGKAALEKFGAIRFIETTEQDYRPVFGMAKDAGIDIRSYNYRNR
jgi:phosphonate transport system substrate-binding protein